MYMVLWVSCRMIDSQHGELGAQATVCKGCSLCSLCVHIYSIALLGARWWLLLHLLQRCHVAQKLPAYIM